MKDEGRDKKTIERLDDKYEHVFAILLYTMEQKAESFCNVR